MGPFRYHVLVCDQQKPEGLPCCAAQGSAGVLESLRRELGAQGLSGEVQVTTCGSLGLCDRGPNMVVYPEGIWYSALTPENVPEIVREHFANGRVVDRLANHDPSALRAEISENREKMLAAQRAREAAGLLPDNLMEMIDGFRESRVLLTAIELDLFTAVGDGATASQVASRLGADERATEMLLNALVALEMLGKRDGAFSNTPRAARHFVRGSPHDVRLAMMHTVNLWSRWGALTECVRAGTSVSYRQMEERGEDWTAAFIAAMHYNAAARAPMVVQAVGVSGVNRMLDVGGGSGAYSIAFAQASETLQSEILDLPAVLAIAQRHIEDAGLAGRIKTRAGDLRSDSFGSGCDLVFISAICHMLDPEENRALFRKSFRALAPGGRVVVQDFILEPDKTAPRTAALFSLNMLTGTRAGASYSEPEYRTWLAQTGFTGIRHVPLPGPTGLIIGSRP